LQKISICKNRLFLQIASSLDVITGCNVGDAKALLSHVLNHMYMCIYTNIYMYR